MGKIYVRAKNGTVHTVEVSGASHRVEWVVIPSLGRPDTSALGWARVGSGEAQGDAPVVKAILGQLQKGTMWVRDRGPGAGPASAPPDGAVSLTPPRTVLFWSRNPKVIRAARRDLAAASAAQPATSAGSGPPTREYISIDDADDDDDAPHESATSPRLTSAAPPQEAPRVKEEPASATAPRQQVDLQSSAFGGAAVAEASHPPGVLPPGGGEGKKEADREEMAGAGVPLVVSRLAASREPVVLCTEGLTMQAALNKAVASLRERFCDFTPNKKLYAKQVSEVEAVLTPEQLQQRLEAYQTRLAMLTEANSLEGGEQDIKRRRLFGAQQPEVAGKKGFKGAKGAKGGGGKGVKGGKKSGGKKGKKKGGAKAASPAAKSD